MLIFEVTYMNRVLKSAFYISEMSFKPLVLTS